MFFNSTYHWLLIEEDYLFIREYNKNNNNNNNDNNKKDENNNSNYKQYVNNYNSNNYYKSNDNKVKHNEKIVNTITATNTNSDATNTISSKLPRKLKQTLSTSMSATMPVEVEKLTTLAIDITENYQQQHQKQQEQQRQKQEQQQQLNKQSVQKQQTLNSWYLSEIATNLDMEDVIQQEYSTKRQIVTPTTTETTKKQATSMINIKTVVDSSSIDNILYGKKANCKSKETAKRCIVNLDTTTTTITRVKTTPTTTSDIISDKRTTRNQIDDVDGYNIDIIEKFLQQLEININTELILAKRRWHQLQRHHSTEVAPPTTRTCYMGNAENEKKITKYSSRRNVRSTSKMCPAMASSHQCMNKARDNNVDDITMFKVKATTISDKHLNNDTSTRFAYDAMDCIRSCTFKSLSSASCDTTTTTTTIKQYTYELTDDYLLHDIW